jgi:hypothetical protein
MNDEHYIFLKSLECGYDHIRDIDTIFEKCVIKHQLNKKYMDFHYVRDILYWLLDRCYIVKVKRGFYNITPKGSTYLNQLNITIYDDTIASTVKQLDALAQSLAEQLLKQKEFDKIHPIKCKYFKSDGQLIDSLQNELKGYRYMFYATETHLKIFTFKPIQIKCDSLLSLPDIEINTLGEVYDL